jgi:hypothetical protein
MKLENLPNTILRLDIRGLTPLISLWEKKKLEELSKSKPKHSPIFIIGAPRTGSTILYQSLTNYFNVSYIDNLSCLFHRNLFFGMYLSNKLYKNKPHNCFKSIHGNTMKTGGLHAPSECGQFWYRWLPRDHHFIDYDEITDDMVEGIRENIFAILNYYNRPFVFKNLNAGQRLRLIHKVYPESKFIWIKRNKVDTISSILKVREKLNIPTNEWWSIKPQNYKDLLKENRIDMVTQGVYYLEKQIHTDLKLFNKEQYSIITYEDLGELLSSNFSSLKNFLDCQQTKKVKIEECFQRKNSPKAKESKFREEIKVAINKLDWSFDE